MLDETQARAKIQELGTELSKRAHTFTRLDRYVTGLAPFPPAVQQAKVTTAYQMLMGFSQANYPKLIIKAATSRMQIGGLRSSDPAVDRALWGLWQDNHMDAESRRGFDVALTHGRVFALIWARRNESPRITLENPNTCIVEYVEGSRYDRTFALRRWQDDDDVWHATLYDREAVYKFRQAERATKTTDLSSMEWDRREVDSEEWPLRHDYGVVPVVEIATNRTLKATKFGHAVGDFEESTDLIDRINLLEFLRLVIAFSSGFPIRVVIGDKIQRDDEGKAIAPFKLAADLIAQLENPEAKVTSLNSADIKAFGEALDRDVLTLAGVTMTPAYFLRSVPIQNVSADTIRASNTPLDARIEDHKPNLSEGYEEALRVSGLMLPQPLLLPSAAECVWIKKETWSLAERADAALKLGQAGMPWEFIGEKVLDLSQEEVERYKGAIMENQLAALLSQPDPVADASDPSAP